MEGVILSASGSHVTKAVTVAELLKRRIPVSHFPPYQFLAEVCLSLGIVVYVYACVRACVCACVA